MVMNILFKIFKKYQKISRQKKTNLFFKLIKPDRNNILLDAGGGIGEGFDFIWGFFKKVIVVDQNRNYIDIVNQKNSDVLGIVGDVCDMHFIKDKSVDYVFSNAVIEHIPKERRLLFAKEVCRVSKKGYFITTPNFWFPFEPHYFWPFFQFAPKNLQMMIKKYFKLGHYPKGCYERIELLTNKELKILFPKSEVFGLKIGNFLIPEILICWEKM